MIILNASQPNYEIKPRFFKLFHYVTNSIPVVLFDSICVCKDITIQKFQVDIEMPSSIRHPPLFVYDESLTSM